MDVTVTGATPSTDHNRGYEFAKVEADLKSAIFAAQTALENTLSRNAATAAKDSADVLYRLHDNMRNVGDSIITSSNLTQAKVAELQFSVASQFAIAALAAEKNKSEILAAVAATELRKVQDQLDEKREENEHYKASVSFGDKFAAIQSQLNSLDQIQRSTNQAINFGSGIVGPQSSTSNQVR